MTSPQMLIQLTRFQLKQILVELKCTDDPHYSGVCSALNRGPKYRAAYEAVRAAVDQGIPVDEVEKVILWKKEGGGHDVQIEWDYT